MKIISLINRAIPKSNIILFNSYPDTAGNALTLYSYILHERPDIQRKYILIWAIGGDSINNAMEVLKYSTDAVTHHIVRKKSIRGIWRFFRCSYIISTHGYSASLNTSGEQKHINLGHGMMLKNYGYMLRGANFKGKTDKADYAIATSDAFQNIVAQSYQIDSSHVYITGQPCTDAFFHTRDALAKFGIDKSQFKKIIVWMPTYRKSCVGDIRTDGNENSFGVLSIFKEHFHEFSNVLSSLGYLLIVKPHPMDVLCTLDLPSSPNIKVFKNSDFENNQVVLYELLGESDLLLTDYSSVFIDYLVMKKPIGFVCSDLDEYEDTRGFTFTPARDYLPGEIITNYKEMLHYINNLDQINSSWKSKLEEINLLFMKYHDDKSSQRTCEAIWGPKKNI